MDHTKQHLTLTSLVFLVLIVLATLFFKPGCALYSVVAAITLCIAYRLIVWYLQSCPHCRVLWNPFTWLSTKRRYEIEPYGGPLSQAFICSTFRTCRYKKCTHYRCEEEARPAYTKRFGYVHSKVLHFRGLL